MGARPKVNTEEQGICTELHYLSTDRLLLAKEKNKNLVIIEWKIGTTTTGRSHLT